MLGAESAQTSHETIEPRQTKLAQRQKVKNGNDTPLRKGVKKGQILVKKGAALRPNHCIEETPCDELLLIDGSTSAVKRMEYIEVNYTIIPSAIHLLANKFTFPL